MEYRCSSVGTQFPPESVSHKRWDKHAGNYKCQGNVNNETSGRGLERNCSQQCISLKLRDSLLLTSPFSFIGLKHSFCFLLNFILSIHSLLRFYSPLPRVLSSVIGNLSAP